MNLLSQISVRKFKNTDSNQIIKIAKALPQWFTRGGIERMNSDLRYQNGFVASHGSEIVGFLTFYVTEGVGHIGWMGILPNFHRQGIGKKLVKQLVSELTRAGIHELHVSTLGDSVEYEPYERTRAFYRGIGFVEFRRFKQDNPECPEQLIMVKNI
jgi:ribosomal protein S18 acetylase RimI-like enzyme